VQTVVRAELPGMPEHEIEPLLDRVEHWLGDLERGLALVYRDPGPVRDRVLRLVARHYGDRPARLRRRDSRRLLEPDWFQRPDAIGYATYADRFAGNLAGVASRVDYLAELGVTYLHLMPLLQPRPAPNDGGYAVADYRSVRHDLGTVADLAALADALHDAGIALALDLVLNHVAREHAWAQAARDGDPRYRAYFHVFGDRTTPDAYEQTLPEVFPTLAPGSFTWDDDLAGWVWTTFNTWQWDLDWRNPDVLCEFVDIVGYLANLGVDCLRLDAVAFLWKRLGTDCQNQPEVHALTQVLRAAAHMIAPSLVFKAEAIVAPSQVVAYLGQGEHAGRVSDLAYDNSLMVQIWSALATRDARLLVQQRSRMPRKPVTTSWATYLRCHDDIGWAVEDVDAGALGWSGAAHRAFLADFYAGLTPGSWARGAHFQSNPATGDKRTSGTAASLAGLEDGLRREDPEAVDTALGRLFLAHAVVMGLGGLPLLYMGDELGLLNDHAFATDPAHSDDNRWMHRPRMPWDVAAERHDPAGVPGRVYAGIRRLTRVRSGLESLHAAVDAEVLATPNPAVFAALRVHPAGTLLQMYNVSEHWQPVSWHEVARHGLQRPYDVLNEAAVEPEHGTVVLPPYAAWWLVDHT
jgi:amylosucrase